MIGLFIWFVLTAFLELVAIVFFARHIFPNLPMWPHFRYRPIKKVWRFSASMYGISLVAILLTQMDRFAVGSYLGLDALGLYSISYSLAAGITLIQTALNATALPAFSASSDDPSRDVLLRRYQKFAQITGWIVSPVVAALILFGEAVVTVWIDAPTAEQIAGPIALLAAGFCLNAFYSNTYLLGVACGHPEFFLRANVIGLIFYGAVLVLGITEFGIIGAALAWFALNLYYFGAVMPVAHHHFKLGHVFFWLVKNFGVFTIVALVAFGVTEALIFTFSAIWKVLAGLSVSILFYLILSYYFRLFGKICG